MSVQAEAAVQNLIEELAPDEYRLLSVIAQSGATVEDFIWPNWEYVLRMTRFTPSQCGRILRGLSSGDLVRFVNTNMLKWFTQLDPSSPVQLDKDLHIWIKGMPWMGERITFSRHTFKKTPIPKEIRRAIFERDDHACKRCGATSDLAIDHIYPESKGGTMDLDNLQTLCRTCNLHKGSKVEE
jgi:hypothetical protein